MTEREGSSDPGRWPWFRSRPRLAVCIAVLLYAAVFTVGLADRAASDTATLLYVLPIALIAVAFGLRAGTVAGTSGVVLLAVWVVDTQTSLSPIGWLTRATPMLLLGVLLGDAADRIRCGAEAQRLVQIGRLRERQAADIHDTIVQGIAVAKWSLEAGQHDRSLELLTDTIDTAEALVADLLGGHPIERRQPGRRARSCLTATDDWRPLLGRGRRNPVG